MIVCIGFMHIFQTNQYKVHRGTIFKINVIKKVKINQLSLFISIKFFAINWVQQGYNRSAIEVQQRYNRGTTGVQQRYNRGTTGVQQRYSRGTAGV